MKYKYTLPAAATAALLFGGCGNATEEPAETKTQEARPPKESAEEVSTAESRILS